MSPHATHTSERRNGQVNVANRSLLERHGDDEIHDLVCVGFGPASLAIAVALHDALESGRPELRTERPSCRFLEQQKKFAWHAGMLLPGAKMQISFVKDLATLRNPRSEFTFLNYLHQKGRLVQFTNLGTFLPQRIEYEDYMQWCATWFKDVVDYGRTVQSVRVAETDQKTGAATSFEIHSLENATGKISVLRAKHVCIATGGRPSIPVGLPSNHPRVIHSSQYATSISNIFPPGQQPRSVAVIGAGQSAAEVFNNIPSKFPDAKVHLLIRGAALRPSDDSPFVNEIFDPNRVDDIYSQRPDVREKEIARDRGTNYSVVRLELLEHIYSMLYSYRIQYGDDESSWPQSILNHRTVTGMTDAGENGSMQLQIQNKAGTFYASKTSPTETLDVDLVVVASGYRRDAHEYILQDLRNLMPGGDETDKRWTVRRDYGVEFQEGAVGTDAGVWLQGCNESTHGLSDSLLSILAMRGGEVVQSILGETHREGVHGKGHASYTNGH